MRVYAAIPLFFTWSLACHALNVEDEYLLKARDYIEAGNFDTARTIYKRLKAEKPEQWQKAILDYDVATAYLIEGDYPEAIALYEALMAVAQGDSLLYRNVSENLALAYFRQAKDVINIIKSNSTYLIDDYFKGEYLLKKTISLIDESSQVYCALLQEKGDALCAPQNDLNKLKIAASELLALLIAEDIKERTKAISPQDGVPLLYSGLSSLATALDTLMPIVMPPSIRNEQLDRVRSQALEWMPLWNILKAKIEGDEAIEAFKAAENNFSRFIEALNAGNQVSASENLLKAEKGLDTVLYLIFKGNPIEEVLNKFLASYKRVIEFSNIQEGHLNALNEQMLTLIKLFTEKSIPLDKLKLAQKYLDESMQNTHFSKNKIARAYLLLSFRTIRQLSWEHDIEGENPVKKILSEVISDQLTTMRIIQLLDEIGESMTKELFDAGIGAQKETVNNADRFWARVAQVQLQHFQGASGNQCQILPWSKVVPLFDKGFSASLSALKELENQDDGKISFSYFEEAVHNWREAIKAMDEKSEGASSCFQGGGGGGGGSSQNSSAGGEKTIDQKQGGGQSPTMQEILRLLQQMEQDDRQQEEKEAPGKIGIEKGW